jgi:hypothetical protein
MRRTSPCRPAAPGRLAFGGARALVPRRTAATNADGRRFANDLRLVAAEFADSGKGSAIRYGSYWRSWGSAIESVNSER